MRNVFTISVEQEVFDQLRADDVNGLIEVGRARVP